jgi:general secretion pathway protein G
MKIFFAVFFAILAAVAVIYIVVAVGKMPAPGQNKASRVYADTEMIKTQLTLYESLNDHYPTTEQGLQALVTQPNAAPKPAHWYQLLKEVPKDPWNNDYIYRQPGLKNISSYDLFSAGPDGKAGTADDIWGSPY